MLFQISCSLLGPLIFIHVLSDSLKLMVCNVTNTLEISNNYHVLHLHIYSPNSHPWKCLVLFQPKIKTDPSVHPQQESITLCVKGWLLIWVTSSGTALWPSYECVDATWVWSQTPPGFQEEREMAPASPSTLVTHGNIHPHPCPSVDQNWWSETLLGVSIKKTLNSKKKLVKWEI